MQTTNYLYRPVISKAWEVTKKHKSLWFFGLFAILVSAGGEYELIMSAMNNDASGSLISAFITSFQSGWAEGSKLTQGGFWANFGQLLSTNYGALMMAAFIFLLIVVVTLFFIWLAVASQIALVKNASLALRNRKSTIGEGFLFANANFWPILGITALLKAGLFIIVSILAWEFWALSSFGWLGNFAYILSFIILGSAAIIFSFILKYQGFYVLLKRQKLKKAFLSAIGLFKENWLISLEMGFVMFGFYLLAASLSVLLLSIFAGIPLIVVPFYLMALPVMIKVIVSVLAFILAILSLLAISSVITVFQWAGWTCLFDKLEGADESVSKIERVAQSVMNIPEARKGAVGK